MPESELDRLVDIGLLEHEAPIQSEFDGLVRHATALLRDATSRALAIESRFSLAYGAAHALATAALRWHGYRPRNRQVVFQALAHTVRTPKATWRMLAQTHEQRNRFEYEGGGDISEALVRDMIAAAQGLLESVQRLEWPREG